MLLLVAAPALAWNAAGHRISAMIAWESMDAGTKSAVGQLLRQHPDFGHLEPELLQLAAQMSHETRELARAYSDVKVARAKSFLQQRQEEVQGLTDRLQIARRTCDDLRRWLTDIESDERQAQLQIRRLEADLKEILPGLGYAFDLEDRPDGNVVTLPKPAARVEPSRPETV